MRGRSQKGERHGRAKLADGMVKRIRESAASNVDLAYEYGVSASLISLVRHHKLWRHLP